jgi:mannose-6-phosphate isomerase-like protein (cupin superfamily)
VPFLIKEEIRYYKDVHKVKIVTESVGYVTVEAMEDFDDTVDGEKVRVKKGETRIVPANSVHKQKTLPPMVKEHEYELEMEKKLKRIVAEDEKKQKSN